MSSQIMVTLPEGVLQCAELWAQRSGRSVPDLLADAIESSLRPLGSPLSSEQHIAACSDDEVLAATNVQLTDRGTMSD